MFEYPVVVITRTKQATSTNKKVHETMRWLKLSYATIYAEEVDHELTGINIPDFTLLERKAFHRSRDHAYAWRKMLEADVPYVIFFEDDAVRINKKLQGERFRAVMEEIGIDGSPGSSDSLNMSAEIVSLADDWSVYSISNYAMRTILNSNDDPKDLFGMLDGNKLPEGLTVRKTSPPLFRSAPRSIHIFWIILALALIVLLFVWVNRERPSRINSGFGGLLPGQNLRAAYAAN